MGEENFFTTAYILGGGNFTPRKLILGPEALILRIPLARNRALP
ncbi:MAG: hypothetical protein QXM47_08315 [Nitrososphaerota archaeon]